MITGQIKSYDFRFGDEFGDFLQSVDIPPILLLLEITFSISTAKNTTDEAAPTKINSLNVKDSV